MTLKTMSLHYRAKLFAYYYNYCCNLLLHQMYTCTCLYSTCSVCTMLMKHSHRFIKWLMSILWVRYMKFWWLQSLNNESVKQCDQSKLNLSNFPAMQYMYMYINWTRVLAFNCYTKLSCVIVMNESTFEYTFVYIQWYTIMDIMGYFAIKGINCPWCLV